MYLILTHDVDWPIHGPGREHLLARLDRFDENVKRRILEEGFNPYFGIPLVMEAEERVGVRSTFFFRPLYDDGAGSRVLQGCPERARAGYLGDWRSPELC